MRTRSHNRRRGLLLAALLFGAAASHADEPAVASPVAGEVIEAVPATTAKAAEQEPSGDVERVAGAIEATSGEGRHAEPAAPVMAPEPAPAPAPSAAKEASLPVEDEDDSEAATDEARTPRAPESYCAPDLSMLVAHPVHGVESSGFGWRDDPIRHRARFHKGADFRAERGTPVYAAGPGVVLACQRRGGYGNMIELDHGGGVRTRYAHLSAIGVRKGQSVGADELIGKVGSTGRSTGAHLHFEVRLRGDAVNPEAAVAVGALQRSASRAAIDLAAMVLRPDVQDRSVSKVDPPRAAARRDEDRRRKDAALRRKRAHIS